MGTVEGVRIGLDNLYYAILASDNSDDGAVYGNPEEVTGAIEANIVPGSSLETLFADNGPMEIAAALGAVELTLNVADIPLSIQAIFLGHTMSAGVLKRLATSTPPWLAIGFRALKSNGNHRYVWLLKGKFREPDLSHATKADTITFQTSTIVGNFCKRDYDDAWIKETDEDEDDYVEATGTAWFTDGPDETPEA